MGAPIQSYRDLVAWQRARALTRSVYADTASFPTVEQFGLTAQMRGAVIAVSSNIAEGYGRGSQADYLRFFRMSRGSLFELESQTIAAEDLGFLPPESADSLLGSSQEVARPLSGLIKSLES